MTLRLLTKFELAKLLHCITPKNNINTSRLYKTQLTNEVLKKIGFENPIEFKKRKVFGFEETKIIIEYFQFDQEDLETIKKI